MKFVGSSKPGKSAHILISADPLEVLCGHHLKPRNWYYVDKSDIRQFAPRSERHRKKFRLCRFCQSKAGIPFN